MVLASILLNGILCAAQNSVKLQKSLAVSNAETVVLSVDLKRGDVDILYSHDGQVVITAVARGSGDMRLDDSYLPATLAIAQSENHLTVRQVLNAAYPDGRIQVRLRIDVPYRTEVRSQVGEGRQTIRGILGPVYARAQTGDIHVSYVSKTLTAEVMSGNIEAQVVGEHVDAKAVNGNIYGERLEQGIAADTEEGDIKLMVVGAAAATVRRGTGRIDVGGVRGSLTLRTDAGDLHVQAVPHNDWKLNTMSGTLRLDLPPVVSAELRASTDSGELQSNRRDLPNKSDNLDESTREPNGGKHVIEVHTVSGKIIVR